MRLNGRNLEPNMRGDDVRLLQDELRQLGFDIADQDGIFGSTTFLAVQSFQQQHNLPATGAVDSATARLINLAVDTQPRNGYIVRGRVVHADGSPVVRAAVGAFEKLLRDEQALGKGMTDQQGQFEISYTPPDQATFSLIVRASDAQGAEIAVSDPICDVRPVETVTLVVGGEALRGPSEYRQLEALLRPALAAERLDPATLNPDEIDLLACTLKLSRDRVAWFAASARLHAETDIPAEAFYGLFRQGLSTGLSALVAQPPDTWRRALEASIATNIIDPGLASVIPSILTALQNQIVRLALQDPEPDRPTFAALFDIARVEPRHHQSILENYLNREGTVEEYWQQLRDDPEISDEQLDELQLSLGLSAIALNHVDLVRHLTDLRRTGAVGPTLRDLSRFRTEDWHALLNTEVGGRKIGAPVFFGTDEAERIDGYAAFLPRMVESLFPTAVLANRLAETDTGTFDFQPALAFLNSNPDFEFRTSLVQSYLDEHPDALLGIPQPEETVATLKSMQRLFEVVPAFNKAQAVASLITSGVTSAIAVRRMGPTQFVRQYQAPLGFEAAQETYTRAARKADTALFLLSQSAVFNPTNPVIIAPHLAGQGIPDLEDLFGSLDLCQCEHCRSVYSPAAYLVDILHYLMNRPTVSGARTALDVLFDRRPDLGEIELNCHNTNTLQPYVDLALEILETAVVSGGTLPIAEEEDTDLLFPFQTSGDSDALGANPEHLNEQAYVTIRDAVYPWLLPFDLWHAEVRTYLSHLNVPLQTLMRRFDFAATPASQAAAAAEFLGLTAREHEIITGGGDQLHALWGFDGEGDLNQFIANRNAAQLAERAGLAYEELTALFDVGYVNPFGSLQIQFDGADCDLDTATVINLDSDALDRIHRFVRLWRRQSWSIAELGAVLSALDAQDLDDPVLVQVAAVSQIQQDLKAPLPVVLSWLTGIMTDISIAGQPPLYEQVFLDPSVHKPELAIFALNASRSELADTSTSLNDHVPITYSVLGISAASFALLIAAELPDVSLNLPNLTRLYQAVSLSKRLGLSISGYVSLRALSGIDPFGPGAVDMARRFADLARRVQGTPFSVAQLDYLLRHQEVESAPVGPAEEKVTSILAGLRNALYQVALTHMLPESSDAIVQMTQNKLELVLPADVSGQILAVVSKTSPLAQEDQAALIETHLSFFLDPETVTGALFAGGELVNAEPGQRALVILEPLLQYLRRLNSESAVVQVIASALGIELLAADQLLRSFVPVPGSDESTLSIFLTDDFAPLVTENGPPSDFAGTTSAELFPHQYASYYRLAKIALVFTALNIPADGTDFFFTQGVAAGWLDLNALPLTPVAQAGADDLAVLLNMAEIFQLAGSLLGGLNTLFDLLNALQDEEAELTAFLEMAAGLTGWPVQDLTYLTGPSALNLLFPAGFRDGRFLTQLRARFDLLSKLAVSAEVAHHWAAQPITPDTANAVKQAARARYEDKAQWLAVARPLRDALREQQRAAVVAYLVHTIRIQVPHLEEPQPQMAIGAHRLAVQELQLKLNMAGAIPPLKVDGVFGPKTRQAVLDFQEAHGLDVDGIVGPNTWAELNQINRPLQGPNELYAHFLIDVEMDPCMLISRVVLANSSVQLFVQRCLLNLEPEVHLSAEDAKEWEWMKLYRVWEANRKVFLYPENWIYPELRDDKTPLFKQMESSLLQDEINDTTVERAYVKYLNDLSQIAELEISGIYRQWEPGQDILHVFGRTRNMPHIYFYRRWIDQQYWTPWERVDVDIEGEHLVPVVWNRRLYLFWPIFVEKTQNSAAAVVGQGFSAQVSRYYEIRLAWSEYREKHWGTINISRAAFTTEMQPDLPGTEEFSFWSYFDDEQVLYIAYELSEQKGVVLQEDPPGFQFRVKPSGQGIDIVIKGSTNSSAPPGTYGTYNTFLEQGTGYHEENEEPLRLVTSALQGNIYSLSFTFSLPSVNITNEDNSGSGSGGGGGGTIQFVSEDIVKVSKPILNKTPRAFRLMLPHAERPHRSQTSLFYLGDRRVFFIIPHGIYVGGFGASGSLTIAPHPIPAPIELPDIVTFSVASFLINTQPGPAGPVNVSPPSVSESSRTTSLVNLAGPTFNQAVPLMYTLTPMYWEAKHFQFEPHYHPYVGLLIEELNRYGLEGIFRPDPAKEDTPQRKDIVRSLRRQNRHEEFFNSVYAPTDIVETPRPNEEFDFDYAGAYAIYNWELFFHAPLMLAKRLSDNQRFAEAHRWFHYIFDPTYQPDDTLSEHWPERVWQIKPFYEQGVGQSIQRTMLLLKSTGLTNKEKKQRKALRDQIEAWRKDPFNPHLIARMRPEAYMKTTVMSYLDNLIAWGDHLFRQDTLESISEATQIYILAAEILGERPREIAAHEDAVSIINGEEVRTFNDLRSHLDAFSNALIELETWIEPDITPGSGGGIGSLVATTNLALTPPASESAMVGLSLATPHVDMPDDPPPPVDSPLGQPIPAILGPTLFFCIPKNDKLLGYWDTVEDRLFKIRHCMNIEGVVRQLPLFQPPIEPGLLVKALAAGIDISSALNDLNAPPPYYRFQIILQKANELINDVKNLGAALLSALEKRDAESLSLLRSTHELAILESLRSIKENQIKVSQAARDGLIAARAVAEHRRKHFQNLRTIADSERGTLNASEFEQKHDLELARRSEEAAQSSQLAAADLNRWLPDFALGWSGLGPLISASLGRENVVAFYQFRIQEKSNDSSRSSYEANMAGIEGTYTRRDEEWELQEQQASLEISQIEVQIKSAEVQIDIAQQDLKSHYLQIENAKAVDEYLRNKYTSPELYGWMLSQIAGVYFQSYQLAYDLARQAERAFQFELGIEGASYIQFGYWDNLKKGLLAGEKLQADLRRLEVAYLEENRREFELTRHISLAALNPIALLHLKEEGRCEIEVPEEVFDLDYPGHYFRRIKSVTLTIPAVTGPYTTLSCTLRLLRSSLRRQSTLLNGQYARNLDDDDPRFSDVFGAIQSIATSSGQNDGGLFEISFRDERYLPFEGAGAISRWQLVMPDEFRQFDYDSISDVILHIHYTAREGGDALRSAANQHLQTEINALVTGDNAPGLYQAFSGRREFPSEFHRFLHPSAEALPQTVTLNFSQGRFPYMFRGRNIVVDEAHVLVRLADDAGGVDVSGTTLSLTHPGGVENIDLGGADSFGNMRQATVSDMSSAPGEWTITVSSVGSGLSDDANRLNPDIVKELMVILHFTVSG